MQYPSNLDPRFRPLTPWQYFGLSILFSIPIVGLVFLIIFSFNKNNINRMNFARSYFCVIVLVLIIMGIMIATGLSAAILESLIFIS